MGGLAALRRKGSARPSPGAVAEGHRSPLVAHPMHTAVPPETLSEKTEGSSPETLGVISSFSPVVVVSSRRNVSRPTIQGFRFSRPDQASP